MLEFRQCRKPSSAKARASKIKLLLFDVDGVLTDGKLFSFPFHRCPPRAQRGQLVVEAKGFHAQDGAGISIARIAGIKTGLITRRNSRDRGGARPRSQAGAGPPGHSDKLKAFREILSAEGLSASEVAFVGDDVIDLPVMRNCGFSVAVANARREVKDRSPLRHPSRRRRWGTARRDRIYSEGAGKMETSGGEVHQGKQLAIGTWHLAKPTAEGRSLVASWRALSSLASCRSPNSRAKNPPVVCLGRARVDDRWATVSPYSPCCFQE